MLREAESAFVSGLFVVALGLGWVYAGGASDMKPADYVPSRPDRLIQSDAEWRARLTPEQYAVLRKHGTERPFCENYQAFAAHGDGVYRCAGCSLELFESRTKFKSGTGWPSFFAPVANDRIDYLEDFAFGMRRIEIRCARCGGHLGHVFDDGPAPTELRYCLNSVALDFLAGGKLSEAAQPFAEAVKPSRK